MRTLRDRLGLLAALATLSLAACDADSLTSPVIDSELLEGGEVDAPALEDEAGTPVTPVAGHTGREKAPPSPRVGADIATLVLTVPLPMRTA